MTVGPKITFDLAKLIHLDVYTAAAVWRRYEAFVDGELARGMQLAPVLGFGARLWVGPSGWSDP